MKPGSIFFDTDFHFNDGGDGKKLFVVLGACKGVVLVVKTTSHPYGKGINYGCQEYDRFHNFYLPINSCFLKKNTWICLDDFYELKQADLLNKKFSGIVNHICDLELPITRQLQDCAMISEDISTKQERIVSESLVITE